MLLELARHQDDPDLRRLLRENPMEGAIRLTLEREPNFFRAAGVGVESYDVIVARDDRSKRVKVMGQCSILRAFVNGGEARVGYMHQLRADRSFNHYGLGIVRGHQKLRVVHGDDRPLLYFTAIVADNKPARRFLEAGVKGMPQYRPLGSFLTLAVPTRRRRLPIHGSITVERGRIEILSEISQCLVRNGKRYQFASTWTGDDLLAQERTPGLNLGDFHVALRDGVVVGCLALWDQRSFKQAVVRDYKPWLRCLRPFINPVKRLTGAPRLPAPGQQLKCAFVSHLAVDGDDPEVARSLFAAANRDAHRRGLHFFVLGLAERHPLLATIRGQYPCRTYESLIYQVCWTERETEPVHLDARILHPEAAIL